MSGSCGSGRPRGVTETTASPGSVPVATSSSRGAGPPGGERTGRGDGGAGDGAVVDDIRVGGSGDGGTRPRRRLSTASRTRLRQPEPVVVAGDRLDLDRTLHSGQPRQLLGDPGRP